MTKIINLFSPKGGVGTSTAVALMAHGFITEGKRVLIVQNSSQDIGSMYGIPNVADAWRRDPVNVFPNPNNSYNDLLFIRTTAFVENNAVTIDDLGPVPNGLTSNYDIDVIIIESRQALTIDNAIKIMVVRPDYNFLKSATAENSDGLIVVDLVADRALTDRDVASVLGAKVLSVVKYDASIGRASDAGLMGRRIDKNIKIDADLGAPA